VVTKRSGAVGDSEKYGCVRGIGRRAIVVVVMSIICQEVVLQRSDAVG